MMITSYPDYVWETVEAAETCRDTAALEQLIATAFERLGASVYVGVDARGTLSGPEVRVRFGRTSPAWQARYFEARHADHDPMVRHMLSSSEVVYWSDVAFNDALTPRERHVFEEAKAFGLHEGLAVPLHHPGGSVSAVLLMGDGLDAKDAAQRRAALLVSHAFSRAARRLSLGAPPFNPSAPRLTRREAEALYWVRKGASDKAIALTMSVSPNTIANYIRSAQAKLGCSKRGPVAQLASDLGLLPSYVAPRAG